MYNCSSLLKTFIMCAMIVHIFKRFVYIKYESILKAFEKFTKDSTCNYISYIYISNYDARLCCKYIILEGIVTIRKFNLFSYKCLAGCKSFLNLVKFFFYFRVILFVVPLSFERLPITNTLIRILISPFNSR